MPITTHTVYTQRPCKCCVPLVPIRLVLRHVPTDAEAARSGLTLRWFAGCRAVCSFQPHRRDLHICRASTDPHVPVGRVRGACSAVLCGDIPVRCMCPHAAQIADDARSASDCGGRCGALHRQLAARASPLDTHEWVPRPPHLGQPFPGCNIPPGVRRRGDSPSSS